MIIAFVVSSVCSLIHIAVQIDGFYPPIRLWYVNTHYLHVVYLDDIYIVTVKDIFIYLITVDGVLEVVDNLLCIINTNNLKTFHYIRFFTVLLYAQQNHSTNGVGKCRVCFPDRFRNLGLCTFAFQCYTLAIQ